MQMYADRPFGLLADPRASNRFALSSHSDVRVLSCPPSSQSSTHPSHFHTLALSPPLSFSLGAVAWSPDPLQEFLLAGSVSAAGRIWLFSLQPTYSHPNDPILDSPSNKTSARPISTELSASPSQPRKRLSTRSSPFLGSSSLGRRTHAHMQNARDRGRGLSEETRQKLTLNEQTLDRSFLRETEDFDQSLAFGASDSDSSSDADDDRDDSDVAAVDNSDDDLLGSTDGHDTEDAERAARFVPVQLDARSSRSIYSLAFDPTQPEILAAGLAKARDYGLYVWDINNPATPLSNYASGESVSSLAYLPSDASIVRRPSKGPPSLLLAGIGSRSIFGFDRRMGASTRSQLSINTKANVGIVADPFTSNRFASYSPTDYTVKLWDIRKPSHSILSFSTVSHSRYSSSSPTSAAFGASAHHYPHSRSITFSPSASGFVNTVGRSSAGVSVSQGRSRTSSTDSTLGQFSSASPARSEFSSSVGNNNLTLVDNLAFSPTVPGVIGVHRRGSAHVDLWHTVTGSDDTPWIISHTQSPNFSQSLSSFVFYPPKAPTNTMHQFIGIPSVSHHHRFSTEDPLVTGEYASLEQSNAMYSGPSEAPPNLEIVQHNGPAQINWTKGPSFAAAETHTSTLRLIQPTSSDNLKRLLQFDVARTMEKRLLRGYGAEASRNIRVTGDEQLMAFWSWIKHAQDLNNKDEHGNHSGSDFPYRGVRDILGGSSSTKNENKSEVHLRSLMNQTQNNTSSDAGDAGRRDSSGMDSYRGDDETEHGRSRTSTVLLEGIRDSLKKPRSSHSSQDTTDQGLDKTPNSRTEMTPTARLWSKWATRVTDSRATSQTEDESDDHSNPTNAFDEEWQEDQNDKNIDGSPPNSHVPAAYDESSASNQSIPQPSRARTMSDRPFNNTQPPSTSADSDVPRTNSTTIPKKPRERSSSAMPTVLTPPSLSGGVEKTWKLTPSEIRQSEISRPRSSAGGVSGHHSRFRNSAHLTIEEINSPKKKAEKRKNALSVLGPDFAHDDSTVIQKCAAKGEIERATAWALWTDRTEDAIGLLRTSKSRDLMLLSPVLAGYLLQKNNERQNFGTESKTGESYNLTDDPSSQASGTVERRGVEYRELCSALGSELDDAFLRASFVYMANGDWQDVLEEVGLPLSDRLAVAIKFLEDDKLLRFLDGITKRVVAAGDLEGVVLTGLVGKFGEALLENYLDRTGDVQTVALASSFPPYQENQWKQERWADTYRGILDDWKRFSERVIFDQWRSKRNSKRNEMYPVVNGAMVRCLYCDGVARGTADGWKQQVLSSSLVSGGGGGPNEITKNVPKCACRKCGQGLPRCSVCLERMDFSGIEVFGDSIWSWCQRCRHGGHPEHLTSWFDNLPECPVAGCSCSCRSGG